MKCTHTYTDREENKQSLRIRKKYINIGIKSFLSTILLVSLLGSEALQGAIVPEDETDDYIRRCQAAHFLSQASMGGNQAEIAALANRIEQLGLIPACEEWIDTQFAIPRGNSITSESFQVQDVHAIGSVNSLNIQNFEYAWWNQAMTSPEQLRLRTAFALSQVFVTSSAFWSNEERGNIWTSYTNYYEKLIDNAFGSYRNLLGVITYDPFMGVYLTYANNSKGDEELDIFPDENYAREVMQLFSCGVFRLRNNGNFLLDENGNPIENYTNDDIRELAQVFTGLSLVPPNGNVADENFFAPRADRSGRYVFDMQMVQQFHDTSPKTLLTGRVLPANQDGDQDISDALDELAEHPSTLPFMCRELIKRFTSSNPSGNYIFRVRRNWQGLGDYGRLENGRRGNPGELQAILKGILLDVEARNALQFDVSSIGSGLNEVTVTASDSLAGRVKEPILKWTQFYRYFEPSSNESDGFLRFFPRTRNVGNTPRFGQIPMRARSVFNFYDTDFSPNSGPIGDARDQFNIEFVSPETEILSSHVINDFEETFDIARNFHSPQHSLNGLTDLRVNLTLLEGMFNGGKDPVELLFIANRDLCNGQMSTELEAEIGETINNAPGSRRNKYGRIMALLMSSPDFTISF